MARVPADQRRQEFVEATVRVIAEHGLADTTTRKIADEAGAPLASLHYCFHSKDELFFAVFEAQAALLGERIGPAQKAVGLSKAAGYALHEIVDWFREHRDWALAQLELELWALRQDPTGELATRSVDVHVDAMADGLRTACGPADDTALAEPVARLIAALADGLVLQWFGSHDDAALTEGSNRAAEALQLFVDQHAKKPKRRRR
jgi:AcrR family transcriptional regulator